MSSVTSSSAPSSSSLASAPYTLSGDSLSIALTVASILTSLIVAYYQHSLPIWLDNRSYAKRKGILGDWISSWSDTNNSGVWHIENINISVSSGRLLIENTDSTGGYKWEGVGRLHADGAFMHGTWRSLKGSSPGVFTFLILSQGERKIGQAFGPDKDSNMSKSGWALGRTNEEMEKAKNWLSQYSRLIPPPSK